MPTYKEIYSQAKKRLEEAGIECVKSELLNIFWYCFGINRLNLIICGSDIPEATRYNEFCRIIRQRCSGVPIQYAIGKCNFMDMDIDVGEGVLIPREDTSVLVNASLDAIKSVKNLKIIDLCSGSGCIAFAIERGLCRSCDVYAVEISKKAFKYLSLNHKKYDSKVNLINDDIFSCYRYFENGYFDLIISNPPYIRSDDISKLQSEVLLEPHLALDGGEYGLDFYENICKLWIPKLKSGGVISFEIGKGQYNDVREIMDSSGITNIKAFLDINNIYRAVIGERV